jgi:NADH-quinone oxidoreductase subunit J
MSIMFRNLIKAAISLALTSAVLALIMFIMNAWLAAVIELSVCAGLITVIFINAISLTKPLTNGESAIEGKKRMKRFIFLPFILLIVFGLLWITWNQGWVHFDFGLTTEAPASSIRDVMWNQRQIDILGQIVVILTGVFGVVILFKESEPQ